MNYCLYFNNSLIPLLQKDKSIEIKIKYVDQLAELGRFVRQYPEHRIILQVTEFANFMGLRHITGFKKWYEEEKPNVVLSLNPLNLSQGCLFTNSLLDSIRFIPFYFNDIITSREVLDTYLSKGVSEVLISGDLGFDLFALSRQCKQNGVRLRVIPNLTPHTETERAVTQFFLRPEEMEFYSKYIDSIEFFGPSSTHYSVYQYYLSGKYQGDLRYLIHGLTESIPNTTLSYHWTIMRASCNRRCAKGKKCKVCEKFVKLAKTKQQLNKEICNKWQSEQKAKKKSQKN